MYGHYPVRFRFPEQGSEACELILRVDLIGCQVCPQIERVSPISAGAGEVRRRASSSPPRGSLWALVDETNRRSHVIRIRIAARPLMQPPCQCTHDILLNNVFTALGFPSPILNYVVA
jgi:hypothetical protein